MTKSEELPLASLVLIAYRQESFVREAVAGALAQTYSPLEIILCDDCSPDSTFAIMEEMAAAYNGPHKVILNRNTVNLGAAENLNAGVRLSSGELIIVQAGDDVSLPGRAEKLVGRWLAEGRGVDLVLSHYAVINESGERTGRINRDVTFVPDRNLPVEKWRCGAAGSCAAYSRRLFAKYGPLDQRVIAEDWVFSFRAWVESGIAVVEEPLVLHRKHDGGISVQAKKLGTLAAKEKRLMLRRRFARGNAAIAEQWLSAWEQGRWREDRVTAGRLRRFVEVRRAVAESFDAAGLKALPLVFRLLRLGRWREAGAVGWRRVCGFV